MTDEIKNPVDALLPAIHSAVLNWQQDNPVEKIQEKVTRRLDAEAQKITMTFLGFDNRFGKWEVDHCNGRAGESAIGDYFKKAQQEAIKEWLSKIPLPTLNSEERQRISTSMKGNYIRVLESQLRQLIEQRAVDDAKALLDAVIQSKEVDSYSKLLKLISQ